MRSGIHLERGEAFKHGRRGRREEKRIGVRDWREEISRYLDH